MSKLIVIEGACDGIGKSTQWKLLRDRLVEDGKEVANHHFPSYGTYHGAPVEHYLIGNYGNTSNTSPYFVNSLYAVDRAITWITLLKEQFEQGKIILLDRYTTSSLIYQSALITDSIEKRSFLDFIIDFEYNKLGIKEPDIVFFLHASFDLITEIRNKRTSNTGATPDIHEADIEYMKKVYDSAMFVADYLSWEHIKCDEDNNIRTEKAIHEDIYSLVKKRK